MNLPPQGGSSIRFMRFWASVWCSCERDCSEGHHLAWRYSRHSQPGGHRRKAGVGQPDSASRRDCRDAIAAQHCQADGGEPSVGAAEGTRSAGENRRQGRENHRRWRSERAARTHSNTPCGVRCSKRESAASAVVGLLAVKRPALRDWTVS